MTARSLRRDCCVDTVTAGPPSLVRADRRSHQPVASATGQSGLGGARPGTPAGADYSGLALAGSVVKTRSIWQREPIPSLAKTLPRWYWTVRALMNNRVPI